MVKFVSFYSAARANFEKIRPFAFVASTIRTMSKLTYPVIRADTSAASVYHQGRFKIPDPYRALEDPESNETKEFVTAQQAVTSQYWSDPSIAPLRTSLRSSLQKYYNYGRSSTPFVRGGNVYVFSNTGLQNQDVMYKLSPPPAGAEPVEDVFAGGEAFLDLNKLDAAGTTALSTHSFSEDGKLWAYALSKSGSDWVTARIKNTSTGEDLEDTIPHLKFTGLTWLKDSSGFFYSRYPAVPEVVAGAASAGTETNANINAFVCFHKVGTSASEDVLVYATPPQPNWRSGVSITDDGEYILLSTSKGTDPVNRLYYCHIGHFQKWLKESAKAIIIGPGCVPPKQASIKGDASSPDTYTYLPFTRWAENFDAEWDVIANDGSRFYLRTNLNAPRYRIVAADFSKDAPLDESPLAGLGAPALGTTVDINGRSLPTPTVFEVVPEHSTDVLDWATSVAERVLILCYLRNAVNALQVRILPQSSALPALNGSSAALVHDAVEIPLPAPGTIASFSGKRFQDTAFIKFVSFLHPGSILKMTFTLQSDKVEKLSLQSPIGNTSPVSIPKPGNSTESIGAISSYWDTKIDGFNQADFEAKQVFVKSKDGSVDVPMFIVHKKGLFSTGNIPPALVYGYGGFNISLSPSFSPLRLAWLNDCSGLYALANIRGGGELGEEWHKGGQRLNKLNCFNDLASCAEYLVSQGLAERRRICVLGGSNGGLLALACALRFPSLFGASVAQVPVTDMMRFHLHTIGSAWRGEYGFAEDNAEDCEYMLQYSPLHTVKAPTSAEEELPSILITTADHDDRVVPLHSFKMAATLQAIAGASKFQTRPLLVRIESNAGHGAGKPLSKTLDEYADVYSFIAHELLSSKTS